MVAHTCDLSYLGGGARGMVRSRPGQLANKTARTVAVLPRPYEAGDFVWFVFLLVTFETA